MPDYKTIDQLPSELNIRDLGGLAAKDGRHVKSGVLFRSSALAFFDEFRKILILSWRERSTITNVLLFKIFWMI